MNLRAKIVFSIVLLGLLCLMLPGSLRADTVYTYTGVPLLWDCSGTYASSGTCAGTYAISVTLDVAKPLLTPYIPIPISNPPTDITPLVLSFTITDGSGLSITKANAIDYNFRIGTGLNGGITGWGIDATTEYQTTTMGVLYYEADSWYYTPMDQLDRVIVYTASTGHFIGGADSPYTGTWTIVTTPEASACVLLGTGLLGLLALAARSKRHAHRA
jgi:hypothetical protein